MAHEIEIAGVTGLPSPWNPVLSSVGPQQPLSPSVTFHPDCVPAGPVAINGWYSKDAADQQQQQCERAYAEREAQQRAQELANAQAQAMAAEQARLEQEAELSADNHCRDPNVARQLLSSFEEFDSFKAAGIKAIDIEHLRTTRWDPSLGIMSCYGTFVFTNGLRLTGTLTTRPNVAGDIITSWIADR